MAMSKKKMLKVTHLPIIQNNPEMHDTYEV